MIREAALVLGLLSVAAEVRAEEMAPRPAVTVLEAVPGCKHAKLGRVSISLGTRKAARPRGVAYDMAFRKLADAAAGRGATAVVLRNHEAAYDDRVKRTDPRPVFIGLEGLAIKVDPMAGDCALSPLDVPGFAARSGKAERIDATTENKAF